MAAAHRQTDARVPAVRSRPARPARMVDGPAARLVPPCHTGRVGRTAEPGVWPGEESGVAAVELRGYDAVPSARHVAVAALRDAGAYDVVDEAELVVSELVTNALLHAGPPVRLAVRVVDGVARIEVHDVSRAAPAPSARETEGMTGRGLALVDAVATRWGMEPTETGKVVWAELAPEGSVPRGTEATDHGPGLASWDVPDEEGGPRYEVTLADVPTELLLAAEEHVDSVLRELTLSTGGSESGLLPGLPSALAESVTAVGLGFADVRHAVKLQALSAADAGDARMMLRLALPVEAADVGARYLAALAEADAHASAARLLTLAAPPQHQAFRRWYVTALIPAVRRAAAGEPPTPAPTFETYLLGEVAGLAELQRVSARSSRLQRVTAALAGALERDDVAAIVLAEAQAELGTLRGSVVLLTGADGGVVGSDGAEGHLVLGSPIDGPADGRAWRLADLVPGGQPMWAGSRADDRVEQEEGLPALADGEPDVAAVCAVPLRVGGRLVGVLRLVAGEPRPFLADERAFLSALAAVAAQAFERADLYAVQATTADRLRRLQSLTFSIAAAGSPDEVLDATVAHAQELLGARHVSVSLLQPDGRTVSLARVLPPLPDPDRWQTFDVGDAVPASEVIRTGQDVAVPSLAARNARWPAIRGLAEEYEHAFTALALRVEGEAVGALTLSFPAGAIGVDQEAQGRRSRDVLAGMPFLRAVADACGLALERARIARQAQQARARLAFLARVTSELADTLDVEQTLTRVARLTVPEIADWVVLHLLSDGELVPLVIEHVDPEKMALAREMQERFPQRLSDPAGVGLAVRTGEPQLIVSLPPAGVQQGGAPPDPERVRGIQALGLRSALIVPLTARGRTHGVLTLITAESGRVYDEGDLDFAVSIGRRAATVLDNARLLAESERRAVGAAFPSSGSGVGAGFEESLSAAEVGRFDLHLAEQRLDADDRLVGFFGFAPEDRASHLSAFMERVHPDDREDVEAAIALAVERCSDYEVEHRVVLPSGEVRWLAVRGRVLVGPDGSAERLAGVAQDVTEVRDHGDQLARLLETTSDAFYRLDTENRFTYLNRQAERLLYRNREDLLGQVLDDVLPPEVTGPLAEGFRRARETGRQVTFELHATALAAWFEVRATPDNAGLSVFFHDITSRKLAEQAQGVARSRLELLAETARAVVGQRETDDVASRVLDVLVPRLADCGVVVLLDTTGRPRLGAFTVSRHCSADSASRLEERAEEIQASAPVRAAAEGRATLLVDTLPSAQTTTGAGRTDDLAEVLHGAGFRSGAVVPLAAGGRVVGVLVLAREPSQLLFDSDDVALLSDVGRRTGLALENTELYDRHRRTAEIFQRSLLTPLPAPDHLELVGRYRAAGREAQVGGDWYDAFLQPDGATVLVIGDVMGHDMNAAAAMGQLRNLLRGTAYDRSEPPSRVLSRVDAAIRGLEVDALATALVVRVEQTDAAAADGLRTVRWSNAGHPPALLVHPDRRVEILDGDAHDLLLGFDPRSERHDTTLSVEPGATLVLCTDGLVERRDADLSDGLARLQELLSELCEMPLEELCDAVLSRMVPESPDDDVALVALRFHPDDGPRPVEAGPERAPDDLPSVDA